MDYSKQLIEIILSALKSSASDIHLAAGRHPTIRVSGSLLLLSKLPLLTPKDLEGFIEAMLDDNQRKTLFEFGEVDFAYSYEDKARFRCNAYKEKGFCTPNGGYWSSTTVVDNEDYAWTVGFDDGYDDWGGKSYYGYVRCVRDGQ